MIRIFVALISLIGVFFISFSVKQEISVIMDIPLEVRAGDEFLVSITISKGPLESFSRFQQDLPFGLTASRVSAANADFTFENQRVRLIWLKLPQENTITAVYKVKVDEKLKGSFSAGAEFSFIEGNERKNIQIKSPDVITIIPNPDIAEALRIDIKDFQKHMHASLEETSKVAEIQCIRRAPVQASPREIIVELYLNKANLDKFAKIEEKIPPGFIASELDSKNGIFSFENRIVKILWMNLPEEQEFIIKYKLFPEKGKTLADLNITGYLSYISGNQTKTVEIIEKKSDLAVIKEEEKKVEDIVFIEEVKKPEPVKTDESPVIIIKKEEKEAVKPLVSAIEESFLLQSEDGIYYRVQLAAGHKPINIPSYFNRLTGKENVKFEFHEGWRKYTIGSYREYRDARDQRTRIWNDTPVKDAFIAAYNHGKRITVQEALMISNQRWYR